mgnify:CR=1 FL=1|tara:strand:- start:3096 stop:3674 length:579 start_codon:yes stop_codon:yes gene_type:complete
MGSILDFFGIPKGDATQVVGSYFGSDKKKKNLTASDYLDSSDTDNWKLNAQQQVDELAKQGSNAVIKVNGENVMRPYEDTRTQAEKDKDDRADARNAAKKSIVTEVAEEEEEEVAEVVEEKKEQPVNTPAIQSVLQDVEIGLKGGTIANEADIPSQGISKSDKTGLRPKRGARMGMLASYQPGSSQSLLASA